MHTKLFIKKVLIAFFVLYSIKKHSQSTTYNTSTVISIPNGITKATIQAWGGGGKGGSLSSLRTGGRGAGGGGGYTITTLTNLTPGDYNISVGTGSTSTAAGGSSIFKKNSGPNLVIANGGNSAATNSTVGASGGSGGTYNGGNGANNGGGGGSSAGINANGVTAVNENGAIAPTGGGNGGDGVSSGSQGNGSVGVVPGGGGGGAVRINGTSKNGGNGANGRVIICLFPSLAGSVTGSATVCQGQNTVMYSIPAITNATSYTWTYSGMGVTISDTTNSPTINFSDSATSGNLTVYGVNECGNGVASANFAINVNEKPTASYSFLINPSNNGEVTFTNTSTNATTYIWDFDDTNNSTLTNPVHTFNTTGTYNVKLTSTNSCSSIEEIIAITVDNTLGIDDEVLSTFSVYPNSVVSEILKLTLPQEIKEFKVEMFSALGHNLYSNKFINTRNLVHEINVSTFKAGIYFITVSTSNGKATKKIIIL